jgi:hypothetical protein
MQSGWFEYEKPKVIQALRYHFISRKEIKILMVVVNGFAIVSAAAFFFNKVSPLAFLLSSVLWFFLMVMFWFVLPYSIYKRARTFKDRFRVRLKAAASPSRTSTASVIGNGNPFQAGWKVRISSTFISVDVHFLYYPRMHLREMMYTMHAK